MFDFVVPSPQVRCIRRMQEVDVGGGYRRWMQEVDVGGGCRGWIQEVDAEGRGTGAITG